VAKQFQHADKVFLCSNSREEEEINSFFSENLVSGEQTSLDFEGLKGVIVI
jgi:histidyl-tRNA synthetase